MHWILENKQKIIIILSGVFTRLVLMPFTIHHDILCTARRASIFLFDGVFLLPYWSELTYTALLFPLKGLLLNLPNILPMEENSQFSVIPGDYAYNTFIQSQEVYQTLFLLKLPFLFIDFLLLILILKNLKHSKISLIFWAFNPFMLYGVYMWGRYEIFPILFALLSFIYAREKDKKYQRFLAVLFMGIAIAFRPSFFLFLPILIIYLNKNFKEFILLIILSIIPFLIFSIIVTILGGGKGTEEYINIALNARIGEKFYSLSLFILSCLITLCLSIKDKVKSVLNYNRFISYSSFCILGYFAFSFFHPQYIAWLFPIAIILISMQKRFIYPFFGLFAPLFLLFDAYYGCYTSVCLLSEAINPDFANSFGSFKNQLFLSLGFGEEMLFNIMHTTFVFIIFYIIYLIKEYIYENK